MGNRRNKQKQSHKKQNHKKPNVKPGSQVVEVKIIKSNEETKIVNEDDKGNLVLTPEDNEKLKKLKALQAKAKQSKIKAKEDIRLAQEALENISGSDAIKAIKQDIEARLKAQEDITSKALTAYQEAKDKLQSIQSEYQALTGIDKKAKASKSKSKASNGNGKFDTVVKKDTDCIAVIVTHKDTKSTFEYSLYPSNGKISKEDWLKLRHSLVSQFERETKEDNLTLRAYLSNLKSKIEAIKAIA